MQRRRFLAGVAVGGVASLLSGCGEGIDARRVAANGSTGNDTANATNGSRTETSQGLVLLGHEFYHNGSSGGVRGSVENRGEVDLDFIAAHARFFDRSGARIGRASDTEGAGLPVGETWRFNAQLLETDPSSVARYRLVVIDQRSSEVENPFAGVTF